jgi:hypothetical protein
MRIHRGLSLTGLSLAVSSAPAWVDGKVWIGAPSEVRMESIYMVTQKSLRLATELSAARATGHAVRRGVLRATPRARAQLVNPREVGSHEHTPGHDPLMHVRSKDRAFLLVQPKYDTTTTAASDRTSTKIAQIMMRR